MQSLQSNVVMGTLFPTFPSVDVQENTVGRSGEKSLSQAYSFFKVVKKYLSSMGMNLTEDSHICDFGCGWGRITRFFLKDVPEENILGLDPWDSLIEECRMAFSNVEFQLIPTQPPYADVQGNRFNLIIAYSVFSHLNPSTTEKIFAEFGRMLKPGGLVIVTSRGKQFIRHCEEICGRESGFHTEYERQLSLMFTNPKSDIVQYELGKPVFHNYGIGFGTGDGSYGEAAYPPEYFKNEFGKLFRYIAHENESLEEDLDQVTIILQRKEVEYNNHISGQTKYSVVPDCQNQIT